LRTTPVAHAIVGTMIAAAALAAVLAVAGLLLALLGSMRDRRLEGDLVAQGLSPRELRAELRLRIWIASALGTLAGIVIAVVLTALALAAVRAGLGIAPPQPSLVTAAPWGELAAVAAVALLACGAAGMVGSALPGATR
jgi:ABC-type lipoprotein release transport system permease subunit